MTYGLACLMAVGVLCAAQERVLWQDPGKVEGVNFAELAGRAGPPRSPFQFVAEEGGGANPKVLVRDGAGIQWRVKGGLETRAEAFVTRLVSALGYYAEATSFVPHGKIDGIASLKRAAGFIRSDGSFSDASFERRDPDLKFLSNEDWAWNKNPFTGTKQLQGLKILMILLSNWDNKDERNWWLGSNTGIFERRVEGRVEWIYFVNDWGQTLGSWGTELKPKGWDCPSFTTQTASFLQGLNGQHVRFGFVGLHTDDFKNDITFEDVRWLMTYLGRITDAQMLSGLKASGATADEAACFAKAIRERINHLRRVSEGK